ncbi:hypothetical protein F5Y16DRAFT_288287 [Xylariaceae sp. FL0255]|nr:hypothetical protein F5Y16DRAFT_288287 [Xylariaceae sp. FL0255]
MATESPKSADHYKSQWPMSYALTPPSASAAPRRWWQHYYYRGPLGQQTRIRYSWSLRTSEAIAKQFLGEPVLGFDMEWPWESDKRSRLQDKVALIQLASEHTIALFHIALHSGNTTKDLIAPSLRCIIESANILKAGVCVLDADFKRLRDYFGLEPKGAFELSHLHNLVSHGASQPQQCTTKLRALSKQVEEHLGLPLWKGKTRTSDWSQPLTPSQIQYAATDAYAGFMLFHCLNAKRMEMDPVPPLPRIAETYLPFAKPKIMSIQLESVREHGENFVQTAAEFYGISNIPKQDIEENADPESTEKGGNPVLESKMKIGVGNDNAKDRFGEGHGASEVGELNKQSAIPSSSKNSSNTRTRKEKKKIIPTLMNDQSKLLFEQLKEHRKGIASSKGVSAFVIAWNRHLEQLAICRPTNRKELLDVPGIGPSKVKEYGTAWLDIITNFNAEQKREDEQANLEKASNTDEPKDSVLDLPAEQHGDDHKPITGRKIVNLGRSREVILPSETVKLHMGLSFDLSTATLETEEPPLLPRPGEPSDSDDDEVFGPSMKSPTSSALKRKRHASWSSHPDEQGHLSQMMEDVQVPTLQREAVVASVSTSLPATSSAPVTLPFTGSMNAAATPQVVMATFRAAAKTVNKDQLFLRKKLEAYARSVLFSMRKKPTTPLLSEETLSHLISTMPQTAEEFHSIPGINPMLEACKASNKDFWRTFAVWTNVEGVGK